MSVLKERLAKGTLLGAGVVVLLTFGLGFVADYFGEKGAAVSVTVILIFLMVVTVPAGAVIGLGIAALWHWLARRREAAAKTS